MSVLCPVMEPFSLCGTSTGFSPEANFLEKSVRHSLAHYLEPKLSLLLPEIETLADESSGRSAEPETVRAAVQFAYCLPRFVPLPEVSVDPDGEISFDWLSHTGEMFSVSVNKQNRLAYAGWFGEKSRVHGIEQLGEKCPQEIIRGIQKATFSERASERTHQFKALHGSN